MTEKTKGIIGWILTGLISVPFLGAAVGKLIKAEEALKMAGIFGIDADTYQLLGGLELVALVLFIIPRTGIAGAILLISFMGGAIATHLQHNLPVIAPVIVQSLLVIVAAYRFPELRSRLLKA